MQFLHYVTDDNSVMRTWQGKGGGECHGSEYEYHGNEHIPISYGIFAFWQEKYLHYSFLNDVIMLHH